MDPLGAFESSPPRKRHKTDIQRGKKFTCDWWLCGESFPEADCLMKHVVSHVEPFELSGSVTCLWKECDLPSDCLMRFDESLRHLSLHVHHSNLKHLGSDYLKAKTNAICSQSRAKVNCVLHNHETPFTCYWANCDFSTDFICQYYSHVSGHAEMFGPGKKTGHCSCLWNSCDKIVNSKAHLREHLRTHTLEKVVACSVCGGTFANREKLLLHVERQTPSNGCGLEKNLCSYCHKSFSSNSLLLQHVYHHVNHYLCPFCGFTIRAPSDLKRHIFNKHQHEKPFICTETSCVACFKTEFDLKRHVSDVHRKETKFDCYVDNCNFSCIHFAKLFTHLKNEHKEVGQPLPQYACHLCPTACFNTRRPLTQHLKKMHSLQYAEGTGRFRYILHEDGCYRMQSERVNQLKDVIFSAVESVEPCGTREGENSCGNECEMVTIPVVDNNCVTFYPIDVNQNAQLQTGQPEPDTNPVVLLVSSAVHSEQIETALETDLPFSEF